jgi:hypothetical protein
MMIECQRRLIPEVPTELEWQYLVGETNAGEEAIVPVLEMLTKDMRISNGLKAVLYRQLDEESQHVRMYNHLLGSYRPTTGYAENFIGFVESLPSLTSKLFVTQTILESISLGALAYRKESFLDSPSADVDLKVTEDEEGHVNFGLAFISELKRLDGCIQSDDFRQVAREANRIFTRYFNGAAISEFFGEHFDLDVNPFVVENSVGMVHFRRVSAHICAENRVRFFKRYRGELNAN